MYTAYANNIEALKRDKQFGIKLIYVQNLHSHLIKVKYWGHRTDWYLLLNAIKTIRHKIYNFRSHFLKSLYVLVQVPLKWIFIKYLINTKNRIVNVIKQPLRYSENYQTRIVLRAAIKCPRFFNNIESPRSKHGSMFERHFV